MSERATDQGEGADQLFKDIDRQERMYAPQQVPGVALPGEERDVGGTAGRQSNQAGSDTSGQAADAASVAGADGNRETVPIVGVRPDISAAAPMPLPATTGDSALDNDETPS